MTSKDKSEFNLLHLHFQYENQAFLLYLKPDAGKHLWKK